jgi:hypothetical protein
VSGRVDTDPIGAIRHELVAAAGRRIAVRRRRRRRGLAGLAVALVALGGTTGALALTDTGTGIPAIDRLLDVSSRPGAFAPGKPLPPDMPAPPAPKVRPVPGSLGGRVSLELPTGEGVAVGYMNRSGAVCSAHTDLDAPARDRAYGGITCMSGRLLKRALETDPARLVGAGGGDAATSVVNGFAREDVESLTVIGAHRTVDAVLSPAWTPRGWRAPPLRFFIALVDARDVGPRRPLPTLRARLADGRVETWP